MSFGYTGGARASDISTAAVVTHGQTINSGDLVVVYINVNSAPTITDDGNGSGATFTKEVEEEPVGETCSHALFWKVANGSEPSTYDFTLGTSQHWQAVVKVFTSDGDALIDAAATTSITASNTVKLDCDAIDGAVISDNALSIVIGGKDNRELTTPESYTVADNSFGSVIGNTDNQRTGVAHRIYATGETFSGAVTIETADSDDGISDLTYSIHISFVDQPPDPVKYFSRHVGFSYG